MSLRVDILSGADADLQAIFDQLEDYRDSLGAEFMAGVEAYLARLSVFPEIAPVYLGSIRRQVMHGFPYGIFYEPLPTRIVVLAVLDLRQDQDRIRRRLQHPNK